MNKMTPLALTGMIMSALITAAPALAKDELPQVTEDGLHLKKQTKSMFMYVDPAADFSTYSKVMILESAVAFKKDWRRDQNRNSAGRNVTKGDMDRISNKLKDEFDKIFREVLSEDNGYMVVDEAADDVLLLRPAIINLDVNAPDNMQSMGSKTYAESAGEMTLYLELYDSVTGDLLGKGMDREADRANGFMTWQNSVANRQAADNILKDWATALRKGLDAAHEQADAE